MLKAELQNRGYKVKIACLYNAEIPGIIQPFYFSNPKVVIVPWLYGDLELKKIYQLFKNATFKLVNLQCEQVLSQKWINAGYHFPKENAQKAFQVCWGSIIQDRIVNRGVCKENTILCGSMATDFDHKSFSSLFIKREKIAKEFNLDNKKKWLLFISSFTLSTSSLEEIEEIKKRTNIDNSMFATSMTDSKAEIIKWLKKFGKTHNNYEIIYRPHPNEKDDPELIGLTKKFNKLHVINDYSVNQWIYISDKISTWISTSIVDALFMNKKFCVLRPYNVRYADDIELFKEGKFIDNYESFENFIENSVHCNSCDISGYYFPKKKDFSYKLLADKMEEILHIKCNTFTAKNIYGIKLIKSLIAYSTYKTNFFVKLINNDSLRHIYKETYKLKKYERDFIKRVNTIIKNGNINYEQK